MRITFTKLILNTDLPSMLQTVKPHGLGHQIYALVMPFFVFFVALLNSMINFMMEKNLENEPSVVVHNNAMTSVNKITKEEAQTPSWSPTFTGEDVTSCVLKNVAELEEKVDAFLVKPLKMPTDKEEMLHAAVYRVEALEAELITTKKVCFFSFPYCLLFFPTKIIGLVM